MATLRSNALFDERGNRYSVIEHEGQRVRVYDGADTALRLIALLADRDASGLAKSWVATRLLFVDPDAVTAHPWEDFDALLCRLLWEVAGIDADGSHEAERGRRVIDWEGDAEYIEASLWATYGSSAGDMAKTLTFRDFAKMVGLCPHETPIGQAIYYRTASEPADNGHNGEEIRRFRKLKSAWALDGASTASEEYEQASNTASDAFAGIAAMAKRGR